MTVGRRQYNEAEMLQMQREAEVRVREMQARARRATLDAPETDFAPQNRNWSTSDDIRRQYASRRAARTGQRQRAQEPAAAAPAPGPPVEPEKPEPPPTAPAVEEAPAPPPAKPTEKKSGTIVGDIMDALGLDEDYLLIIGLLLILINQRADTTLILALAYLLI